jgi:hypothetical protein
MGHFTNFEKEMCFPFYKFYLKKRLDEPAQFKTRLQFGWAYQPVRINPWLCFTPKEQGVVGKLARIATGVFGAWHSHVWARSATISKICKGELIKVTIGITEPMIIGGHDQVPFGEPKEQKDLQFDSKEFKMVPRL